MARLYGRGPSRRPSSQVCKSHSALPRTLRTLMLPDEHAFTVSLSFPLLLGTLLAMVFSLVPAARAQSPVDDVHVSPRIQPPPPPEKAIIDPSLRTHTKPMKVDVDLVLVPVTITDPMNRLVTGLDK
jgi:hypothetical protein